MTFSDNQTNKTNRKSKRNIAITTFLVGVMGLSTINAANATMLMGQVQNTQYIGQAEVVPQPMQALQVVQATQSTTNSEATENAERTATKFQGHWKCMTTVVESNVAAVTPGTRVQCDLTFQKLGNGVVKANWMQSGWSPSESTVGKCANGTLHLSHTNQFTRGWTAHAEDFAKVTSPTTMISTSIVDQYSNGMYIGRYKTQSQLIKIDG